MLHRPDAQERVSCNRWVFEEPVPDELFDEETALDHISAEFAFERAADFQFHEVPDCDSPLPYERLFITVAWIDYRVKIDYDRGNSENGGYKWQNSHKQNEKRRFNGQKRTVWLMFSRLAGILLLGLQRSGAGNR